MHTRHAAGFTLIEALMSAIIISIIIGTLFTSSLLAARAFRTNVVQVGPTNRAVLALQDLDRDFREASACIVNNSYWITFSEPQKDTNGLNTFVIGSSGTSLQVQTSSTQVHYFLGVYNAAQPNSASPDPTGTYLFRATGAPGAGNTFTTATALLRGGLQAGSVQSPPNIFSSADAHCVQVTFTMTPDSGLAPVTVQTTPVVSTQLFLRNTI